MLMRLENFTSGCPRAGICRAAVLVVEEAVMMEVAPMAVRAAVALAAEEGTMLLPNNIPIFVL